METTSLAEYENHNYDISNYSTTFSFTTGRRALVQRTADTIGKRSQNVCFGLMVKFHTTTKVILYETAIHIHIYCKARRDEVQKQPFLC